MRLGLLATMLLLTAAAGCRIHTHYVYEGGVAYVPPPAPPAPPAPPPPVRIRGEVEVQGSDGTFGWQRTCNADVAIHELSERMARKGCQFDSYGYDETQATCEGSRLVLRRDATHVYRLCPSDADRGACREAWAHVLAR
jgi:hypothetical protein